MRGARAAALAGSGLLLVWAALVLSREPCLGVADNLDYWRVARPAGIAMQTPEKVGYFVVCSYPLTTPDLAALPSAPAAAAWLVARLARRGEFDLRVLGLSYLLIAAGLLLVALLLGRPAAAVLGVTWVVTDPGFLLFFNSLYAEACMIVGILGAVLLVPATALLSRRPEDGRAWATWALVPCAALAGLSKMQYSPFPALLLVVCLVSLALLRRRPARGEVAFLAVLGALALAAPWHFARGSGPRFPAVNDYDAVFRGIAVLAQDPASALDRLAIPEPARALAGSDYFAASPEERTVARESLRNLSRWRLALLYAGDPQAVARAADHAARELWRVRTHPRGNYTERESDGLGRTYSVPFQFSLWRERLLGWLPAAALWFLLAVLAAGLVVAAARSAWSGADTVALLLVLWVPVQCAVVILGDGLVNLQQHLLGARLGLDLLLVVTAIRMAAALARGAAGRLGARGPRRVPGRGGASEPVA